MNVVFLMLALFLELAAAISLKLSHGFSKRIPALATVVFSALSLTLLSFALNVKGFEVGVVYAVWSGVGMAFIVTIEIIWKQREKWNDKDIGPIGTMARIGLGLGFVGSVVHGQRATRLAPASLPTRPHWLLRSRAGLALVAHSPQPDTFPRHQPFELRAQRRTAPRPLPHLVVCALLLRQKLGGAPLRWHLHGARGAPRLRRMRDAGPLQLAPAPHRPDRLRRLHAHRLPGALQAPVSRSREAFTNGATSSMEKNLSRSNHSNRGLRARRS
jgi:small multidrug resistance pump